MTFLGWLEDLSETVDKVIRVKSATETLLNAARAHGSVTAPIRAALDLVRGKNVQSETSDTDKTDSQE